MQREHHVARSHSLASAVLHNGADILKDLQRVSQSVAAPKEIACRVDETHALQVLPQDHTCLFVDGARDAFDASATCETPNVAPSHALNVLTKDLPATCEWFESVWLE